MHQSIALYHCEPSDTHRIVPERTSRRARSKRHLTYSTATVAAAARNAVAARCGELMSVPNYTDPSKRILEPPDLAGSEKCRLVHQNPSQSTYNGWYGESTSEQVLGTRGEFSMAAEPTEHWPKKREEPKPSSFVSSFNTQRSPPRKNAARCGYISPPPHRIRPLHCAQTPRRWSHIDHGTLTPRFLSFRSKESLTLHTVLSMLQ